MTDRRVRGGNIPGLPRSVRCALYERDEWECGYCGVAVEPKKHISHDTAATIDHVIPCAVGGITYPTNLVTCCAKCNREKCDSIDLIWVDLARKNTSRSIDLERGKLIARQLYPHNRKKKK